MFVCSFWFPWIFECTFRHSINGWPLPWGLFPWVVVFVFIRADPIARKFCHFRPSLVGLSTVIKGWVFDSQKRKLLRVFVHGWMMPSSHFIFHDPSFNFAPGKGLCPPKNCCHFSLSKFIPQFQVYFFKNVQSAKLPSFPEFPSIPRPTILSSSTSILLWPILSIYGHRMLASKSTIEQFE